jgi:DNA polymerase I
MKKLLLIDGFSLLFRAYFATAYSGNLMKNSKGQHTNMIFGFANMLQSVLKRDFTHILVAFDSEGKTFRHDEYKEYKAGRNETPKELIEQIPLAKDYVSRLGIAKYEQPLLEADDIIGTLAKQAAKDGFQVEIFTGDKDLLQLVDDLITVNITKKGLSELDAYNDALVLANMGVPPNLITDLKGLMGDSSDNLPGIPGVGPKTAVKLLQEYGSLEQILAHAGDIPGKLGENIRLNVEMGLLCKKLATIETNATLAIGLSDIAYQGYDTERLNQFYRDVEFRGMIKTVATPVLQIDIIDVSSVYTLTDVLVNGATIMVERLEDNYHHATILGITIVAKRAVFIPFTVLQEPLNPVVDWLANPAMKKQTFDAKAAVVSLLWHGFDLQGIQFDLLLASYVANPSTKDELVPLCMAYDYTDIIDPRNLFGRGEKRSVPSTEEIAQYSLKNAMAVVALAPKLLETIKQRGQLELLELEMKLAITLAHMEVTGVIVDTKTLSELQTTFDEEAKGLEARVQELAGISFNLNSPKQLGEILFEQLGLPHGKKTKTGYSTSVDVLENLRGFEIVDKLLQYRSVTKLKSTYLDGIEKVLHHKDGVARVHTIFKQATAVTGRLSSIEPNLQNLPIKTEQGQLIRKLFVPSPGNVLLGADYSQVELRILAHFSNTKELIDAFKEGKDIHTTTAMKVFGVKEADVTSTMRRQAKAVNFGILYGQGAWGLSEGINVSQAEAKQFIEDYYESFPGIYDYLTTVVNQAKADGYVETILKRRRYLPDLQSSIPSVRAFGERTAKNAPIQGSAADIIKQAMVNIDQAIHAKKLQSKLIIQIHDELIFDCVPQELSIMRELVEFHMKNAVTLSVPLDVEMGSGTNLYQVK